MFYYLCWALSSRPRVKLISKLVDQRMFLFIVLCCEWQLNWPLYHKSSPLILLDWRRWAVVIGVFEYVTLCSLWDGPRTWLFYLVGACIFQFPSTIVYFHCINCQAMEFWRWFAHGVILNVELIHPHTSKTSETVRDHYCQSHVNSQSYLNGI